MLDSFSGLGLGLRLGLLDRPAFSSACLKAVGRLTVESLLADDAGLTLLLIWALAV